MNQVSLSGRVSDYGPKISWTSLGKPQLTFTLVYTESGRDGVGHDTFIPVLLVGANAEPLGEVLAPGERMLIEGKLAYHKGGNAKDKDAGRLTVVCYGVERLDAIVPAEEAMEVP